MARRSAGARWVLAAVAVLLMVTPVLAATPAAADPTSRTTSGTAGAPSATPPAGAPSATPPAGAPSATPPAGAPSATPPAGAPSATATGTDATVVTTLEVSGPPEPGSSEPVHLDARVVRRPDVTDAPAVLLAHGFGGTWQQSLPMAQRLADDGFVVVVWTARGFGASGGRIHLDDPRYEGRDVSALVDALADEPVRRVAGDPVVAVAGVSYGAAISVVAAAEDPRIDAAVPIDGWADLGSAFFPNSVIATDSATAQPDGSIIPRQAAQSGEVNALGPLKAQWLTQFFGTVTGASGTPSPCGRMDPTLCAGFLSAAESGHPGAALSKALHASSPAELASRVTVPVLILSGVADSLFGLDQADLLARSLTASPSVSVRWIDGGHGAAALGGGGDPAGNAADGDSDSGTDAAGAGFVADADISAVTTWLHAVLDEGSPPAPTFSYPVPGVAGRAETRWESAGYPDGTTATDGTGAAPVYEPLTATGRGWIAAPPGGVPASITGLTLPSATSGGAPGRGGGLSVGTYALAALPGQSTTFDTAPATQDTVVVGAPVIRLCLTAAQPGPITLFLTVWRLPAAASQATLDAARMPRPLLATVRVGEDGQRFSGEVAVALPASTYRLSSGSVWRVLVTTTNASYANPTAAGYTDVELGAATLTLPTLPGATLVRDDTTGPFDGEAVGLLIALAAFALALAGWVISLRVRARALPDRPELAEVPLALEGISKTYADGQRAVQDVSFQVEPGQVVGLLGPNGAGKTTAIRMLLGLIRPTKGNAYVLGHPIRPGAPVLRSVGALVEGPGFLPHLTGRQNLLAYWAATGRPLGDADLDSALDVAALNDAVDRPVRTYSQGMRQRLGIAQAMLGAPQLLILDEPTNGLDPPQIAAMRQILHDYAATGRSVLVSSHLLAEVEQTCSHVVVMRAGRVLAAGSVADLLSSGDGATPRHLEEVFLATLAGDLDGEADAASVGTPGLIERLRRIGR